MPTDTQIIPAATATPAAVPNQISVKLVYDLVFTGRSPDTVRAYRQTYDDFAAFLGLSDADAALRALLALPHGQANALGSGFRADMERRKLATASVSRHLGALRSFVTEANRFGLVDWELNVRAPKVEGYRDTAGPGIDNYKAMLGKVIERIQADLADPTTRKRNPTKGKRDLAILHLLFNPALRRSSVATMDLADVDFDQRRVHVIWKKRDGKIPKTIPVSAVEAIRAWVEARGDDAGPLFFNFDRSRQSTGVRQRLSDQGIWRIVKEYGEKLGLDVAPHKLRHTGISEVAKRSGGNLPMTAEFAGHKNWNTTKIYVDRAENLSGQASDLIDEDIPGE